MLLPDIPDIGLFFRDLRDRVTEGELSGSGFSVDRTVFREGYRQLYAVYEDVVTARTAISTRATAIDTTDVSHLISGVTVGAYHTRSTVADPARPSLASALLALENEIAQYLEAMYLYYTDTNHGDREAAGQLAGAAQPSTP